MNLPRFDLLVLPRTREGYRGAFFGTLLSLFLDYFGSAAVLIAILAFGLGIACAPHLTTDESAEGGDNATGKN
jgi:hypothetical protein